MAAMTDRARTTPAADEAWAKYPNTILELHADPVVRIDLRSQVSAGARARLAQLGLQTFAVLTAENPDGEEPQEAPSEPAERRRERDNQRRLSALERALQTERIFHVATTAHSADGEHAETCFAIELDARAARRWARRFSQLAYFFFDGQRFWLHPGTLEREPLALPRAGR
jgi:hypothetical protein